MSELAPSPIEYTVRFPTQDQGLRCMNRIVNSCQKFSKDKITTFETVDNLVYVIRPHARFQEHRILPKIKIDGGEILDAKYEQLPVKKPRVGKEHAGYWRTHPDRYDVADFLTCVQLTLDNPHIFNNGWAMFHGDPIQMQSMRYQNFLYHGCKCVRCGIEGAFFLKQKSHQHEETYHMNLYALGESGKLILMTRDHIIPKSKGGPNTIENLQTMCGPCNWKKGNKLEAPDIDQQEPHARAA